MYLNYNTIRGLMSKIIVCIIITISDLLFNEFAVTQNYKLYKTALTHYNTLYKFSPIVIWCGQLVCLVLSRI